MLFIIIGLIIGVVLGIFFKVTGWFEDDSGIGLIALFAIAIVVGAGFGVGLLTKPLGYTDYQMINEVQLTSINDSVASVGSGRRVYVSVSAENVYSYYYEVISEFSIDGDTAYQSGAVIGSVTVIENNSTEKPVLEIYEKHGKKSFLSFAVNSTKYHYVFRVPEGSVVHQVKLGD